MSNYLDHHHHRQGDHRMTDPTNPTALQIGYNDDGVVLYRTENGEPVIAAQMDPEAAKRYAADLRETADHFDRAIIDFGNHRKLIDDINSAVSD